MIASRGLDDIPLEENRHEHFIAKQSKETSMKSLFLTTFSIKVDLLGCEAV
jgi:hypothetical protein